MKLEHYRKGSVSIFQNFLACIEKMLILGGKLRTRLSIYKVLRFSRYFLITKILTSKVWQLVRRLVYTMLITNSHLSFHLWWKQNMVKHQKVWEYYDHDCKLLGLLKIRRPIHPPPPHPHPLFLCIIFSYPPLNKQIIQSKYWWYHQFRWRLGNVLD